jgi:hypothetical protein
MQFRHPERRRAVLRSASRSATSGQIAAQNGVRDARVRPRSADRAEQSRFDPDELEKRPLPA